MGGGADRPGPCCCCLLFCLLVVPLADGLLPVLKFPRPDLLPDLPARSGG